MASAPDRSIFARATGRLRLAPPLPHQPDKKNAGHAGDDRDEEDGPEVLLADDGQQRQTDQRPQHSARGISHPVEAVGAPVVSGVAEVGDEGIAGRGAHPLAKAVGDAGDQHLRPAEGGRQEQLADGGEAVARSDERLPQGQAVGVPAGGDLHQAGGALGETLDDTEDGHLRA